MNRLDSKFTIIKINRKLLYLSLSIIVDFFKEFTSSFSGSKYFFNHYNKSLIEYLMIFMIKSILFDVQSIIYCAHRKCFIEFSWSLDIAWKYTFTVSHEKKLPWFSTNSLRQRLWILILYNSHRRLYIRADKRKWCSRYFLHNKNSPANVCCVYAIKF